MISENPYRAIAAEYDRLLRSQIDVPPEKLIHPQRPEIAPDAPKVLLFSPHPDDECLIGGLPLRLLRELKFNVINVAVTLGSRRDRILERWQELQGACNYLGFGFIPSCENGLSNVNPVTRRDRPDLWHNSVQIITNILQHHRPQIIFCPHERDSHSTHIGTHYLVMDALAKMGSGLTCFVVETEFWGAMDSPNLMVESSPEDLADLMAATAFHVGEVQRNPYHLRLPAWMADNVRRGGELVGGSGATVPDLGFATLYRIRKSVGGKLENCLSQGAIFSREDNLRSLFD